MLPDTFIAGAQKSGTTMLHNLLANHAEIFLPRRPQEIHFFDLDRNYRHGVAWYERHFRDWSGQRVVVQTSPLYLYEPHVPERIAAAIEAPRFIFTLRHPVQRAYSHYWHQVSLGTESLSFPEAVRAERSRIAKGRSWRRVYSYVDRGRYARQLARFVERFGRQNLLVHLTEHLADDLTGVKDRCAQFLGVPVEGFPRLDPPRTRRNPARQPRSPALQRMTGPLRRVFPRAGSMIDRVNLKRQAYPPMDPETRAALEQVFAPEIERLQALELVDVSHWRA